MAITANTEKPRLFSIVWTHENRVVAGVTTLVGIATILVFATTNYFDATRQGVDVQFGRSVWMYSVGLLPWFLMAPAVVIISKYHLFGHAPLSQRLRDGMLLALSVFSVQFLNLLFVFAPLMGIPSSEIAGQVGLQAWIPDLMMFVIAVLCGHTLRRTDNDNVAPIGDTPTPVDIVVKSVSRMDIVSADDVMAVSAQGNYVSLVTKDRDLLHRATLSNMRSQLIEHGFIQIHRSHLVKSREIASVHRKDGRVRELVLRNGATLPVSPKGARMLPAVFGNTES